MYFLENFLFVPLSMNFKFPNIPKRFIIIGRKEDKKILLPLLPNFSGKIIEIQLLYAFYCPEQLVWFIMNYNFIVEL